MTTQVPPKRFTTIATENFVHAVKLVSSEGLVYDGKPIKNERDVCNLIGVHQQALSAMKSGERAVTIEQAAQMCHTFNFNFEWMFARTGPMRGKDSASSRMDIFEQKLRDMEAIILGMKAKR